MDLPETLQIEFMGAQQNTTEKIEDWTNKLFSLGIKAFRELPKDQVYSQAVW